MISRNFRDTTPFCLKNSWNQRFHYVCTVCNLAKLLQLYADALFYFSDQVHWLWLELRMVPCYSLILNEIQDLASTNCLVIQNRLQHWDLAMTNPWWPRRTIRIKWSSGENHNEIMLFVDCLNMSLSTLVFLFEIIHYYLLLLNPCDCCWKNSLLFYETNLGKINSSYNFVW